MAASWFLECTWFGAVPASDRSFSHGRWNTVHIQLEFRRFCSTESWAFSFPCRRNDLLQRIFLRVFDFRFTKYITDWLSAISMAALSVFGSSVALLLVMWSFRWNRFMAAGKSYRFGHYSKCASTMGPFHMKKAFTGSIRNNLKFQGSFLVDRHLWLSNVVEIVFFCGFQLKKCIEWRR